MRDPNEPSIHDHDAPYNEEEYIDVNGEVQVRCGCSSCQRERKRHQRAERAIEEAEFRRDEERERF